MLSSNVSNLLSTICKWFSAGASFEVIFQNDKKERNNLNLILITDLPFYPNKLHYFYAYGGLCWYAFKISIIPLEFLFCLNTKDN